MNEPLLFTAKKNEEIIKENKDRPDGWKIVSEPSDEPQLRINNNAHSWSTEWTSSATSDGKKIGSVPDFLQELRNELHGPDFDYFSSLDNSHEKADESDYHYKTPLDSHDFLSHHQNPKTIQLSDNKEWWIPHQRVLEVQQNEANLNNARRIVASSKQKAKGKLMQKTVEKAMGNAVSEKESNVKTMELDKKIINIMKKVKNAKGTVEKKQRPISKNANGTYFHNKEYEFSSNRNSLENILQNDKDEGSVDEDEEDESNKTEAVPQVSIPLEKMVKKLVTGVQGILQLKKSSSQPAKGSWALSYKANNTNKGGKHKNITYLEANNLLLKFNNSNENQEDWSLIFHRNRSDISKSQKAQNQPKEKVVNNAQRLKEINSAIAKRDNVNQGKKKAKAKKTLVSAGNGWYVVKPAATDSKKKQKGTKSTTHKKTLKKKKVTMSKTRKPLKKKKVTVMSKTRKPLRKKKVILSKTRKPLKKKKVTMSKTRKPLKKKKATMSKTRKPLKKKKVISSKTRKPLKKKKVTVIKKKKVEKHENP